MVSFRFNSFDNLKFDMLDIEFFCRQSKVTLNTGGVIIKTEEPVNNLFFQGYKHLKQKKVEKIKLNGFKSFYSNLYNFMLTKNHKNLCTLDEALHVIKVCEAVKKCAKNKRKYII